MRSKTEAQLADPMTPLTRPPDFSTGWDRALVGFPWIGRKMRYHRKIVRQLKDRSPEECLRRWPEDGQSRRIMQTISSTVCEWFAWPRDPRFIPEDSFSGVFWDYFDDLGVVEALLELEEALSLPEEWALAVLTDKQKSFGEVVAEIKLLAEERIPANAVNHDGGPGSFR